MYLDGCVQKKKKKKTEARIRRIAIRKEKCENENVYLGKKVKTNVCSGRYTYHESHSMWFNVWLERCELTFVYSIVIVI